MLIFSRYSWWFAAMLGLALFLVVLSPTGALNPFQNIVLRVATPFENLADGIFQPAATLLSDAGNLNELQDENRRLRVSNEELQTRIAGLERQAQRAKELEEVVKIPQVGADRLLPANIVNRDSSPFNDTLSIDRGANDGIRRGMIVLSAQGSLIGTVTDVRGDRTFVRLLTDSRSKVSAQVLESEVPGLIKGGAERGLSFEFARADVAVDDTIVSSGIGGNYPPGIPIGKVSQVSGTPQDLFRKVLVEPLVRFSTAQTVLVNITFVPQNLAPSTP